MRRGCIAISEVECNECGHIIEHGERYLATEAENGDIQRTCLQCCFKQSKAGYLKERGQEYLTLFADSLLEGK